MRTNYDNKYNYFKSVENTLLKYIQSSSGKEKMHNLDITNKSYDVELLDQLYRAFSEVSILLKDRDVECDEDLRCCLNDNWFWLDYILNAKLPHNTLLPLKKHVSMIKKDNFFDKINPTDVGYYDKMYRKYFLLWVLIKDLSKIKKELGVKTCEW